MARLARVVALHTPHHVTQRGNDRQFVFESDTDRTVYLQLLQRHCDLHDLSIAGYCLMSNHVHLIAIPHRPDSLASALKNTHGRYAAYFNARRACSGHVWQGRYYSCPLDPPHFWAALRYIERNPVRSGLSQQPGDWRWSSAAIHCGAPDTRGWIDLTLWRETWTVPEWREYVAGAGENSADANIRRNTHSGRPLGSADFVRALERTLRRNLLPIPGGRPPKKTSGERQAALAFGAH